MNPLRWKNIGVAALLSLGVLAVFAVPAGPSLLGIEPILLSMDGHTTPTAEVAELDSNSPSALSSTTVASDPIGTSVVPSTSSSSTSSTRESQPASTVPETTQAEIDEFWKNFQPETTLPVETTVPEFPDSPVDQQFQDLANQERTVELQWSNELEAYAKVHLRYMISTQVLEHSDISRLLTHWSFVGENVGKGGSVDAIHSAYMNSPTHAENVTEPQFTHFGSASDYDTLGVLWTCEVFGAK